MRRELLKKPDLKNSVDIAEFARTHPELVIAQWISTIDKIAAKSRDGTPEQRSLREKLGNAAWSVLSREILHDLTDDRRRNELKELWRRKIHPYGEKKNAKGHGRERGRWYARFAGETAPDAIDDQKARVIAQKIHEHLHEAEYRIGVGRPNKRQGRIAMRAESISDNVIKSIDPPDSDWSQEDCRCYSKAGNIAAAIRKSAERREDGKDGGSSRRIGMDVAAKELYRHWAKLFPDGAEGVLSIAEARKRKPGLFTLHGAVRDAYTRTLKHHGKGGKSRRPVSVLLPGSMEELYRLVEVKKRNRRLNALVRLGRIIHYEAGEASGADAPCNVTDNWPDDADIRTSRYCTSSGQSKIKRNEAFVRVWRHTIALASRTLTDWTDPSGKVGGDVLLKIGTLSCKGFNRAAYAKKLPLLFGKRHDLFDRPEHEDFEKSVLRLILDGWASLRHASFHFKGRDGFTEALKAGAGESDSQAVDTARKLLKCDIEGRRDQLIAELRSAHVEYCFEQAHLEALASVLKVDGSPRSPLPRFRRVLDRVEKAWRREPYRLRLPPPDNRRIFEENCGRRCRYITIKMLYERGFPIWLEGQCHKTLNNWIAHAVERTTAAAKDRHDESAVAKAAGLIRLRKDEGIAHFVDRLAAETATELRVQRGYDSDADNARKQAKYIDDLRCDVVGQAFERYLEEKDLNWILDEPDPRRRPEKRLSDLGQASVLVGDPTMDNDVENWQAVLYLLVHMVPVDAIGRLRHQLRKWTVLEQRPSADVTAVERLLDLYLAMHDAKFEGGEGVDGIKELENLFESPDVFSRVCLQTGSDADRHVPWRGLREVLRFGDLRPLMSIFKRHVITSEEACKLANYWEAKKSDGSRIAIRQAEREQLHEKWFKSKKEFSDRNRRAYSDALDDVIRHRHMAAHVRLIDHARLHRLLMSVLGRLADYAGLWERDLYFVTLALVHFAGMTPEDVFSRKDKGLNFLESGRIVEAVRSLSPSHDNGTRTICTQLEDMFGEDFLSGTTGIVRIRNDLMHFNMLCKEGQPNLTAAVNDTRRLMAHDRKLKNAVSRSIIELLAREGLNLEWKMDDHTLCRAKIASRRIFHLGNKTITEDLHGEAFVDMAAVLFGGTAHPSATTDERTGRRSGAGGQRRGKNYAERHSTHPKRGKFRRRGK